MQESLLDESEPQKRVDVVVLGGGLAGLTVALQIKQERPETDILVVERNEYPVPESAFKVGESTLEGAAYYLGETLGLKEHLQNEQLNKIGIRIYLPHEDNSDISQRLEVGLLSTVGHQTQPSYQLDRGRLENMLSDEVYASDIDFWDNCKVKSLSHGEALHTVTVDCEGDQETIQARWIIDASGRAGLLRKKLGLNKKVDHKVNAAWLRVNQRFNLNLWSKNLAWRKRVEQAGELRVLCTTQLTGPGYWVWVIPLAPNATSIGIVADETIHPFNQFNRLDRALNWLDIHEPQCAKAIQEDQILDFLVMGHYARGCSQVFSSDRWAITGIAGAFPDPLYAPGCEMIATSNLLITDMVIRALDGEEIADRVTFYNRFYLDFLFELLMAEYQEQYPYFGDPLFVTLKKVWQAAWYWGTLGLLIFHPQQMCDLEVMKAIEPHLWRVYELHEHVQKLFRNWPLKTQVRCKQNWIDYVQLKSILQLQIDMNAELDGEQLTKQIADNVILLEMVACEIIEHIQPESLQESQLTPATPQLATEFKNAIWNLLDTVPQTANLSNETYW